MTRPLEPARDVVGTAESGSERTRRRLIQLLAEPEHRVMATLQAWHDELANRDETDAEQRILGHAPVGIAVLDGVGQVQSANDLFLQLLGTSRSHVEGLPLLPHLDPDGRRRFVTLLQRAFALDEIVDEVLDLSSARGTERRMRTFVRRVAFDPEVGPRCVAVCIDVTDDTNRVDDLAQSAASFRAIIERAPDAVVVHDDGAIVYVNPKATELFGAQGARVSLGAHFTPASAELARARWDDVRRTRQVQAPIVLELEVPGRGHSRMEVIDVAAQFDGRVRTITMLRDITERLARQTSMIEADRLASLGTMAASIAHELNNPLAYLVANLELMRELVEEEASSMPSEVASDLEAMLQDASDGAHRMRKILGTVRAMAQPLDAWAKVDVQRLVEGALLLARGAGRCVPVDVVVEDDTPHILGNEGKLQQVLVNLLANAMQAVDEPVGAGVIRVHAGPRDGRIELRVEDSGPGVPPELRSRIFDPFFTTRAVGEGTGLGLAVARAIVVEHEGTLTCETADLGGARFTLVLPAARDDVAPAPARILAFSRDAETLRGLVGLLEGHDVTSVEDLASALAQVETAPRFDLILTDLDGDGRAGLALYTHLETTRPSYLDRLAFLTPGVLLPDVATRLARTDAPTLSKPIRKSAVDAWIASRRSAHS
ncbi:MAG: ATP-binding protein [Deltaproteobacteria bacterium]